MRKTFSKALDDMTTAAKRVAFWEDHGSRRDGNLERARADYAEARRRVYTAGADHFAS